MEYEEVIQEIGDFGKYQKRLLAITFFPILFSSFSTPINIFLFGEQNHRCRIPGLLNDTYAIQNDFHLRLINESIPLNADGSYKQCYVLVNGSEKACDDWVFDKSVFTNTINSQFGFVCEKKLANSHAAATYFFGQFTSPLILIPLADVFGRRLIVCIGLTGAFIANILMPFSTSVYMFAVMRYFDGVFNAALYGIIFVVGIELLSASKRVIAGTVILLVFCLGEFFLGALAYFIRDWRWLQLAVAIPMAFPLIYWWPRIFPESVRWLISRGRMKEAIMVFKHVAKTNGRTLPEDLQIVRDKAKLSNIQILKELFTSKKLLCYWAIAGLNWFIVSFIYYGIKINLGKFGGNIFLLFNLLILAETLGSALLFFMDILGHKRLHMLSMGATCVSCVASIFPILFAEDSLKWITVIFALLGKLFVSSAFGMVFVYTGEIFPTVVRSFTLGSCGIFARLASIASPYLYHMVEGKFQTVLPLILYAVIITVVTLLTIILPETKKRKLPDQIKESEQAYTTKDSDIQAVPTEESDPDNSQSKL